MTKEKFLELLPAIREAAKELGYAIGLHGSLARDFDIVAIPWTIQAASSDNTAKAIYTAAKGERWRLWWDEGKPKPHGRKAYSFDWNETNKNWGYCDLSIMPILS